MKATRFFLPLLLGLALFVIGSSTASAQRGSRTDDPPSNHVGDYVPGEVLVQYSRTSTDADRARLRSRVGGEVVRSWPRLHAEKLRLLGMSVEEAILFLRSDMAVAIAEPNSYLKIAAVPNDSLFSKAWHHRNTGQDGGVPGADIGSVAAWDRTTGSQSVLVAVFDTDVEVSHPDLAANIYTNPGEVPANGIDDDNNGYVDDVHGWDFANNDPDPSPDPFTPNVERGHGTSCAGVIAAVGNNGHGVVGVTWGVKVLPIKLYGVNGYVADNALSACLYCIDMGVKVTSHSYVNGSSIGLDALTDAGILSVAAAGNSAAFNSQGVPGSLSTTNPGIISVAASDRTDNASAFTNRGPLIGLFAPGVDVWTTIPTDQPGGYGAFGGTSAATPVVAGAAALFYSQHPGWSPARVRRRIEATVDKPNSLAGLAGSGGRLRVDRLVAVADTVAPAPVTDLALQSSDAFAAQLGWTSVGDNSGGSGVQEYRLYTGPRPLGTTQSDLDTLIEASIVARIPSTNVVGQAMAARVKVPRDDHPAWFTVVAVDSEGNASLATASVQVMNLSGLPQFALRRVVNGNPTSVSSFSVTVQSGDTLSIPMNVLNVTPISSGNPAGSVGFGALQTFTNKWLSVAPLPPVLTRDSDMFERFGGVGPTDAGGYSWVLPTALSIFGAKAFTAVTTTGDAVIPEAGTVAQIGFEFPFYGANYTSVRVSRHGYLTFGNSATAMHSEGFPDPSVGGGVIAPLLNNYASATVSYLREATRFVVHWEATRAGAEESSPVGFDAILTPDGSIVFQYTSSSNLLGAAMFAGGTIGIQPATGPGGLSLPLDLASNLVPNPELNIKRAIHFFPKKQWARFWPATNTSLSPGASMPVGLTVDARGLVAGSYVARLHAVDLPYHDYPSEGVILTVNVQGQARVATMPNPVVIDSTSVGWQKPVPVLVKNLGAVNMSVTGVSTSGAPFSVSGPSLPLTLTPDATAQFNVTFSPTSAGAASGQLTVTSSDPVTPSLVVPVSGAALPPPVIQVTPSAFSLVGLNDHTPVTRMLHVSNTGGNNYHFTPSAPVSASVGATSANAGGYSWIDSNNPLGPQYSWVDVRTTGSPIELFGNEHNVGPLPLGFAFPFYGQAFTALRVSTNGFITFTSTATAQNPQVLPNAATNVADNMVAPFWDNLNFTGSAQAYFHSDGHRAVIQFQDVPRAGETGLPNTFEVILFEDGTILYQYQSVQTLSPRKTTIGIQDGSKTKGLTIASNPNALLANGLAIRIQPSSFVAVSAPTLVLAPGQSTDLTVSFSNTHLWGGSYPGIVRLSGDLPSTPDLDVPVTMNVRPSADIVFTTPPQGVEGLPVGAPTPVGGNASVPIAITNLGSAGLVASPLPSPDPMFAWPTSPITLSPNETKLLTVQFQPTEPGQAVGTVTITSNDSTQLATVQALTAEGVPEPVADASGWTGSGAIKVALAPDLGTAAATKSMPLSLGNGGEGQLDYSLEPLFLPTGGGSLTGSVTIGMPVPAGGPDLKSGPSANGEYRWADDSEPDVPDFAWVEASTLGGGVGAFTNPIKRTLPFPFTYYGQTYSAIYVSGNGWASFSSTVPVTSFGALPSTTPGTPANVLAVAAEALTSVDPIGVYEYMASDKAVIQWKNMEGVASGSTYDCELILYPNGTIDFQYKTVTAATNPSATITAGIQNGDKSRGLTFASAPDDLHDGQRIRVSRQPSWLALSPSVGSLAGLGYTTVQANVNASGLPAGDYEAQVRMTSNDPAQLDVGSSPFHLHVGVVSNQIDVLPATITSSVSGNNSTGPLLEARVHRIGTAPVGQLVLPTMFAERVVPRVPGYLASSTDWANVKFGLFALGNLLTEGPSSMVRVMGELNKQTWYEGVDSMRFLRPTNILPASLHAFGYTGTPSQFTAGTNVSVSWTTPSGITGSRHDFWLSRDGGATWTELAHDMASSACTWPVTSPATTSAVIGIVVRDALGLVGTWTSSPFSILSSGQSAAMAPVDPQESLPTVPTIHFANPAMGQLDLRLELPRAGKVELTLYDVRGAVAAKLASGQFKAGIHSIRWQPGSAQQGNARPGIYFLRAELPNYRMTKRVTLLR